jgi:hypothetical protein
VRFVTVHPAAACWKPYWALARRRRLPLSRRALRTTQLDSLAEMGCEMAQGYFLGEPGPPEYIEHLLRHEAAELELYDVV